MKNLESRSKKEDVARNAFKKLEGQHLQSLLQSVCAHHTLKDATTHNTQPQIDALTTEQSVTLHVDHCHNKDFAKQTAGMRRFCRFSARGLANASAIFSHVHSCRCEDLSRSRSTGHVATEDWSGKLGLSGKCKKLEVLVAVARMKNVDWCTPVADWGQGSTSVTADPVRAEATAEED